MEDYRKPNILLIVMDAVRPDHLSCYGYERRTTPNLDELSKSSLIFDNAFSTASWTSPSHASLATGLYPHNHRVWGEKESLSNKNVTFGKIFSSKGYNTLFLSSIAYLLRAKINNGFKRTIDTTFSTLLEKCAISPRDFLREITGLGRWRTSYKVKKIKEFAEKKSHF